MIESWCKDEQPGTQTKAAVTQAVGAAVRKAPAPSRRIIA